MNMKEVLQQQEKQKVKQELHQAVKNRQEYEAQERLNEMRDKRMRAELGIQYLKAHQKIRQSSTDQKYFEKNRAMDHYKNSNYAFDRNEKVYTDQLARKMSKLDAIQYNTLSPNQKFPTHTIDTLIKSQAHNELVSQHVQQKQDHDEQVIKMKT